MTIPFVNVKPKSVKLKVSPRFPAQLIGRTGIAVTKSNGNYLLDLSFGGLPVLGAVPSGGELITYDPVAQTYAMVPSFAVSSGLSEAPSDGTSYGRKNAGWGRVLNLTDGGTVTGNVTFNGTATFGGGAIYSGSATFSGSIAVPTVPTADNSTNAASTAYVKNQFLSPTITGTETINNSANNTALIINGNNAGVPDQGAQIQLSNAQAGSNPSKYLRVNASGVLQILNSAYSTALLSISDAGVWTLGGSATVNAATFNSPTLTGSPVAPTPATADNSTAIATTAFVKSQQYGSGGAPATLTGTSGAWGAGNVTIINASGTFTLTLPTASANNGRILLLKSIAAQIVNSASSNVVPLGSATAGTAIFTAAVHWATLVSDGTNWITMASA